MVLKRRAALELAQVHTCSVLYTTTAGFGLVEIIVLPRNVCNHSQQAQPSTLSVSAYVEFLFIDVLRELSYGNLDYLRCVSASLLLPHSDSGRSTYV